MIQTTWRFRDSSRIKGNPQEIGQRLQWLKRRNDDILKPELVLEDAQKPSSPLHDCFEWNDTKAAQQHRLWQARMVINSIELVLEYGDSRPQKTYRAFLSMPSRPTEDGASERYYLDLRDATEAEYEVLLSECARELRAVRDKYSDLKEFGKVWGEFDRTIQAEEAAACKSRKAKSGAKNGRQSARV
ncbi:MAG: hypothetical protein M0R06_04855 [Sphaerochaeta sp.]|jgi:hypothetical protein|nr:hypothetical protein [Sphaerochaeta sp.]